MTSGEGARIRTPIGEMALVDGDVIVHTIDDGAIIDSGAAAAVLDATRTLADGRKVAVVVDLRAVGFADRAARDSFASDPAGGIEVATALVAGPRVSEFLADLFVRSDPGRPTAVFGDPEAALVWALDQVQAHRNR